ncbi:ubiquinol-cytochrome c reductase iron-sulfur subunit [Luminiphilus sp.]|jgi:ubiquinol-cytochrome c reductase iron-sulfur subunit|nr:ubiquinol-cytochrome c reductase iron-sulfur subunit [Halieaceae bacterium]MDA9191300.1 ubiquinol-cytochrome c reductase iron-sulfur subunit [bacterium]MDA9219544.1 ubiquinol-cytochrome c reductase iron-sulfur subunit [Luminiphilus sp.]MDA9987511.1 ubiquinol-cytochrome c reductase iron-sulfur subunit [Luminiphilus sp.]|tara:strand:- start:96 stop:716 length:621 start_codon:yes stop_codon:yes gene_type:complete
MTDTTEAHDTAGDHSETRRRFLTAATSVVGVGGVAGVAVPFLGSWNPSEKAKAAGAPVRADIGGIEPGQMVVIEWRGKPVYVLRRTAEQVSDLATLNGDLKDPLSEASAQPAYISGEARALNEELLVIVGLCTHLGCAPKFRPEVGAADMGGDEWLGGFFCPCHGSKFDLAGRVYKGVPASANLEVPPYSFEGENVLVIGVDAEAV